MKKPGRVPRQKIEDTLIRFLQDFGMKFDNQAPSHMQALHIAMLRYDHEIEIDCYGNRIDGRKGGDATKA